MNFVKAATGMSAAQYRQLKTAVEIGRWPNGQPLTAEQKQISLEALLHYEVKHLPPEQRSGYIPPKTSPPKTSPPKIGSVCDSYRADSGYDGEQPLRWRE